MPRAFLPSATFTLPACLLACVAPSLPHRQTCTPPRTHTPPPPPSPFTNHPHPTPPPPTTLHLLFCLLYVMCISPSQCVCVLLPGSDSGTHNSLPKTKHLAGGGCDRCGRHNETRSRHDVTSLLILSLLNPPSPSVGMFCIFRQTCCFENFSQTGQAFSFYSRTDT